MLKQYCSSQTELSKDNITTQLVFALRMYYAGHAVAADQPSVVLTISLSTVRTVSFAADAM
jgi:hypothetical protein